MAKLTTLITDQENLNTVVTEYAMTAMGDYALTCNEFQKVLHDNYKPLNSGRNKCEAEVRTQGLTRPYVVVSCNIEDHDTYYSDFSGKKYRPTVLKEFPKRRDSFRQWYGNYQKPYQHRMLFDYINQVLGPIGSFHPNVDHPIGYCAEQNVANRLMLVTDAPHDIIQFSIAIRPKTGQVVPYCDNCKKLFNQLNDVEI